jgi:hypothetical protein
VLRIKSQLCWPAPSNAMRLMLVGAQCPNVFKPDENAVGSVLSATRG